MWSTGLGYFGSSSATSAAYNSSSSDRGCGSGWGGERRHTFSSITVIENVVEEGLLSRRARWRRGRSVAASPSAPPSFPLLPALAPFILDPSCPDVPLGLSGRSIRPPPSHLNHRLCLPTPRIAHLVGRFQDVCPPGVAKGFRNCPGHPEGSFETLRVARKGVVKPSGRCSEVWIFEQSVNAAGDHYNLV